jgi:hypothetical protein
MDNKHNKKSRKQVLFESDEEFSQNDNNQSDDEFNHETFIDEIENITALDKTFIDYLNLNKIMQNKKFKIKSLFKKDTKYGEALVLKTNQFTTILPSRFNKLNI